MDRSIDLAVQQMQINHQKMVNPFLKMIHFTLSHLQVCRLLYMVALIGNPETEPNLGLWQLLQRDHCGGDGHHHPLRGARLLVDVVEGGAGSHGGEESCKGEQMHPYLGGDLTHTHDLSLVL